MRLQSLKQVAREIKTQNLNLQEAMKKITYSFISTHQLYVQEAVYNVLLELWLLRSFPRISFINTNQPQSRISMIKLKEELKELSDDGTDVIKRDIIDRYIDRPVCGKFACLKMLVLPNLQRIITKNISENDC